MKTNYFKIFLTIFFVFGFFRSYNTVFAAPPSCAGSGFCMIENQACPGGIINNDVTCTGGNFNGKACCEKPPDVSCGNFYDRNQADKRSCTCASGSVEFMYYGQQKVCCGWVLSVDGKSQCFASANPVLEPPIVITEGLTNDTFDALNPLKLFGSATSSNLSTPGGIISRLLNFLFPLAGLVLFLLISWGGFEILLSSASQKGIEAGKNRITAAVIGFILLISTYWMAQIVEIVFHIKFL